MKHLEDKGSITSMEAIKLYGATRLSAIIYNLRHVYGMNIETHEIDSIDRYGHQVKFGKYVLKK
jgi:hypothetical protein